MLPNRLKKFYKEEVIPKMMEKFKYKNVMAVPKLEKITLSMCVRKDEVKQAAQYLTNIAGQKSVITKAKKSIAQFNVREGFEIGAKVTLRKDFLYFFLDRFLMINALRDRKFQAANKKSINVQKKNLSFSYGVKDIRFFHEIKVDNNMERGLNVTICSNAKSAEELKFLLENLGFPFKE